ncbi:MAG: NAD-dependent epimerase/dehydratase family protein [Proteobacteria bacterium]|nr:NAD-dependent epimerase/dehydratase family protein [Pseudomonadota bacterium]
MQVSVTGANGFVGSHIVWELLHRGHEVTALVGADIDNHLLAGMPVKVRDFDLRDRASVRSALDGAEAIIHSAACYAFWKPDPREIYRVNVDGTRFVLDAARDLGVSKVVYTSSTATLSPIFRVPDDRDVPGDEEGVFDIRLFRGHYKMSKAMAEIVALRAAARGLPLVITHPTTVIGAGDCRPTPSGSMIQHYINGHMKVFVEMAQNVVDVRDVAIGHVLALEKGAPGERFVLGGDNLSMRELLAILAELTGIPAPRIALPLPLLSVIGRVMEWIADTITHKEPAATLEAALHARDSRYVSIEKARRELGYAPRPARAVLADAVRFFASEGYCKPAVADRILHRPELEAALREVA